MDTPRDLVTTATDMERTLTALGLLRAYNDGDDDAVAAYRDTFSASYLHFGLVAIMAGIHNSMDNPRAYLAQLEAHYPSPEGFTITGVLQSIRTGAVYAPDDDPTAMTLANYREHLDIAMEFLHSASEGNDVDVEEVIAGLQRHILKLLAAAS